jgi:hypothetical protein
MGRGAKVGLKMMKPSLLFYELIGDPSVLLVEHEDRQTVLSLIE